MIQKKICLIGASAVGKTSLIRRYVDGIFSDKYLTTIGVKIDKKLVSLADSQVQLLIWDIEGTDKFCGFQSRYLNGASAFVIVIDQSRPNSFSDALAIFDMAQAATSAPCFVVLNKSDLPCLLADNHIQQLTELGVERIFNTSAKSGDNVPLMFDAIADTLVKRSVKDGS